MFKSYIYHNFEKSDNAILFVHIPKNAGTTLASIIEYQYIDTYLYSMLWCDDLPAEEKERIILIKGHFHFGIHETLPHPKYSYFIILRDPIDRVLSHYYYIKNTIQHQLHEEISNIDLLEFVSNPKYDIEIYNLQTRYLIPDKLQDLPKSEHNIIKYFSDLDFEVAKYNLINHFNFIGIAERFDESIILLNRIMNWNVKDYKLQNKSSNRLSVSEVSNEVLEIIKKKNEYDIKIYELANILLSEKLNGY